MDEVIQVMGLATIEAVLDVEPEGHGQAFRYQAGLAPREDVVGRSLPLGVRRKARGGGGVVRPARGHSLRRWARTTCSRAGS